MALKRCLQKSGLRRKDIRRQYKEDLSIFHKKKEKKSVGFYVNRFNSVCIYSASTIWNWLLFLICMLIEIIRLTPVWIYELFRFCPGQKTVLEKDNIFLNIGHRGAAAHEIENIIPSLEKALYKYGADSLEIDLSMTKDNKVVLWHDWNPDDLTSIARQAGLEPDVKYRPFVPVAGNKRKPVPKLTLEELRTYYGYAVKAGYPEKLNAYIPTFREYMEWAVRQEKLKFTFLDVKTPSDEKHLIPVMLQKISDVVNEFKPNFNIVFMTPERKILEAMKEVQPENNYTLDSELPMGIVIDPPEFSAVQMAVDYHNTYASAGRPTILQLGPWTTYRRQIKYDIKLRKKHNSTTNKPVKKLIGWTINRRREMKCLLRMGINGIVTDRPDRLRNILVKYKKAGKNHQPFKTKLI